MNKRLWLALLGAWVIIMIVAMNIVLIQSENSQRDGSYCGGYSEENAIYAIDQRSTGSYAFKFDAKGHTQEFAEAGDLAFERFDAITSGDEGPAVAVSRANKLIGYEGRSYQIITMTDGLSPLRYSPVFTLPDGAFLSHISQEAGVWYIAAVSEDGASAWVYNINASEFLDSTAKAAEEKTSMDEDRAASVPSEVYSRRSEDGLSYVEAIFKASTLYIRTDREKPAEVFTQDEKSRSTYESANVGILGRMKMCSVIVWGFLIFMALGVIVFVVIILWAKWRPHLSWAIAVVIVVAMALGCLALSAMYGIQKSADDQAIADMSAVTESLQSRVYDIGLNWMSDTTGVYSDDYQQLMEVFDCSARDILLVESESERIVASHSRKNLSTVAATYGQGLATLCKNSAEGKLGQGIVNIHGVRSAVSALSLHKDYGMDYVLVALGDIEDPSDAMLANILIFTLIAFGLLFVVVVIRTVYRKRSLDKLADAMTVISDGKGSEITIPEDGGGVLSHHWEILNEIAAVLRRINYKTYQIYEAYFRFAPKKIETILDKASIAEVHCGDVVSFTGTEAILKLSEQFTQNGAGISRMNEILELMERHQDKIGGVLVSSDMSVGLAKLIFRRQSKTISFGLDFLHEADTMWPRETVNSGIILHHGTFRYGVAGTPRQSMAFLDSAESRLLEKYAGWLYKLGLRLIITESMKENEGITDNLRYIGYVEEEGVRLDLYEVIDANTSEIRAKKLASLNKYNEALEHFKQSNFYFARNGFSEILRESPEDALVKWYLFESEKYLNQAPGDDLLKLNAE